MENDAAPMQMHDPVLGLHTPSLLWRTMLDAAFVWNYLGTHMKANEQSPRSKEEIFDTLLASYGPAHKSLSAEGV
jgi:hypothetical protein